MHINTYIDPPRSSASRNIFLPFWHEHICILLLWIMIFVPAEIFFFLLFDLGQCTDAWNSGQSLPKRMAPRLVSFSVQEGARCTAPGTIVLHEKMMMRCLTFSENVQLGTKGKGSETRGKGSIFATYTRWLNRLGAGRRITNNEIAAIEVASARALLWINIELERESEGEGVPWVLKGNRRYWKQTNIALKQVMINYR